ncbi:hypothetical protein ABK040_005116 [Willaertia magna]
MSITFKQRKDHYYSGTKTFSAFISSIIIIIAIILLNHVNGQADGIDETTPYLLPLPRFVFPTLYNAKEIYFSVLPFKIYMNGTEVNKANYPVIDQAIERHNKWMWKIYQESSTFTSTKQDNQDIFQGYIEVFISESEKYPKLDVISNREQYNLVINSQQIKIESETTFGFVRGLETLSQLIKRKSSSSYFHISNTPLSIFDKPRYKYRGLLIDVARHFIRVETIKDIIDIMSFEKLNVLHIHFIDAQSFPFQVYGKYSALSSKGSFAPNLVYSSKDIAEIITYAYYRGIQVIPEFDMPGHGFSWKNGFPKFVSSCPGTLGRNVNNYPLNPAEKEVYEAINTILQQWQQKSGLDSDIAKAVDLSIMHLGADELVQRCWRENYEIIAFMEAYNEKVEPSKQINNTMDLWGLFQTTLASQEGFKTLSNVIYWEELYTKLTSTLFTPDKQTSICQVWTEPSKLIECLNRGYRTIYSAGYYLNLLTPMTGTDPKTVTTFVDTWVQMYLNEPNNFVDTTAKRALIMGVEAAAWGETITDQTIIPIIWPRMSAISERGWSNSWVNDTVSAKTRLINYRCEVLMKRGFTEMPAFDTDYCKWQYYIPPPEASSSIGYHIAIILAVILFVVTTVCFIISLIALRFFRKYKKLKLAYHKDMSHRFLSSDSQQYIN